MEKDLNTRLIRGFVVESGEIQPIEAIVKDVSREHFAPSSGEAVTCLRSQFNNVLDDYCDNCNSHCEAYIAEARPAFGKLVSVKTLDEAEIFRQKNIDAQKELNKVYQDIPSTECTNCGKCCYLSVDLYSVEFLQIIEHLKNHVTSAELKRFVGLCGMNLALEKKGMPDRMRCIFWDEKNRRCIINDRKPLSCRLYTCEENKRKDNAFCRKKRNSHERVSAISDVLLIISGNEIIISKKCEMNRFFLL